MGERRCVLWLTAFLLTSNISYSFLIAENVIPTCYWWVVITCSVLLVTPWITLRCYGDFCAKKKGQPKCICEGRNGGEPSQPLILVTTHHDEQNDKTLGAPNRQKLLLTNTARVADGQLSGFFYNQV